MKIIALALSVAAFLMLSSAVRAEISVYECAFDNIRFALTIYDDERPARIGEEVGVGDKAQVYFDTVSKALIAANLMGPDSQSQPAYLGHR